MSARRSRNGGGLFLTQIKSGDSEPPQMINFNRPMFNETSAFIQSIVVSADKETILSSKSKSSTILEEKFSFEQGPALYDLFLKQKEKGILNPAFNVAESKPVKRRITKKDTK
jgi:hypothetical protein